MTREEAVYLVKAALFVVFTFLIVAGYSMATYARCDGMIMLNGVAFKMESSLRPHIDKSLIQLNSMPKYTKPAKRPAVVKPEPKTTVKAPKEETSIISTPAVEKSGLFRQIVRPIVDNFVGIIVALLVVNELFQVYRRHKSIKKQEFLNRVKDASKKIHEELNRTEIPPDPKTKRKTKRKKLPRRKKHEKE